MTAESEEWQHHAEHPTHARSVPAQGEVVIGIVSGIDIDGQPLVDFPGNGAGSPVAAMSTVGIEPAHVGRQVALSFVAGKPQSPVILGVIYSPLHELISKTPGAPEPADCEQSEGSSRLDDAVVSDGRRILLSASEEVVLSCGESSITLTRSGKIMIRGNYVVSRSTGVNRILGGAVQIN